MRFSTQTLLALYATMPLRPIGLPMASGEPKFWYCGAELAGRGGAGLGAVDDDGVAVHPAEVQVRLGDEHAAEAALAGQRRRSAGDQVVGLVVVAGGDEDPVTGRAASTAAWIVVYCRLTPLKVPTSSTLPRPAGAPRREDGREPTWRRGPRRPSRARGRPRPPSESRRMVPRGSQRCAPPVLLERPSAAPTLVPGAGADVPPGRGLSGARRPEQRLAQVATGVDARRAREDGARGVDDVRAQRVVDARLSWSGTNWSRGSRWKQRKNSPASSSRVRGSMPSEKL